jgi:hypothetical protein
VRNRIRSGVDGAGGATEGRKKKMKEEGFGTIHPSLLSNSEREERRVRERETLPHTPFFSLIILGASIWSLPSMRVVIR